MTNIIPITHALFDMDGLLLDTEIIYTRVTQTIVGRFDKVFDWSVKSNMIGRPAIDSARYLVTTLDLPISAETYLEERNALLKEYFAECDALPGAEKLIRHLSLHNIPIAVATSSSRELFDIKSSHHDWFSLFEHIVTPEDEGVINGKPAPDIFLVAAEKIGGQPENTLVFEDAPSGLAAGVSANMRVVVVPDPNMDRDRYKEADLILDSLDEFDPSVYGLPGYSELTA